MDPRQQILELASRILAGYGQPIYGPDDVHSKQELRKAARLALAQAEALIEVVDEKERQ